jgi:hypothetical protein
LYREDEQQEHPFDDLLDVILPDGGMVAMLRAYFDASHRPSGVFTVAGYLFDSAQARKFRREMAPVFQIYGGLHTADLVALKGAYKNISRQQSDTLIQSVVPLIRSRMICGVAVSCWVQDVENHSPRWIRGFGHPYAVCCHLAMTTMGIWARENDYRSGIAYVFEAGDAYASEADDIMQGAAKHPIAQESYQYKSHAFLNKTDTGASPIQAADFLAWEWGKFFEETLAERKREMRLSLAYLINGQLDKYKFQPMHGERFLKYLDDIRDLGLEELQERKDAIQASASFDATADIERAEPDSDQSK